MGREISRRDFLRIFPGLAARKAESVKDSIREATGKAVPRKKPPSRPPATEVRLPAEGELVEGLPLHHLWLGAAHALAAWMKRPRTFAWRLGVTGEAFCLYYSREEPEAALRRSPGNTFILALAVSGITAHGTHGGPFEPALGGVEVALGRDLSVVLATRAGPALVREVDREGSSVLWVRPGEDPARISFEELEEEWRTGWWPGGEAPFVRIVLEQDADRPAEKTNLPAIEAGVALVRGGRSDPFALGAAAWEAFAEDLRENRFTPEQADALIGELLPKVAVARLAAGSFLADVAKVVPESRREAVSEAARLFRHIHAPSIAGDVFGTGLLPEAAECLLTDQLPDHEKLADRAYRERAAELFLEIRDRELQAARLIEEAFTKS